jgi:hypothetical protein
MPRRRDDDWIPGPKQDIDYPTLGPMPRERPRGKGRAFDRGRLLDPRAWPVRRPTLAQARIGDVIAGNLELRATCRCGHSAIVESAALAKFDRNQPLRDILDKVRCTQCRRYGKVAVNYPEPPSRRTP